LKKQDNIGNRNSQGLIDEDRLLAYLEGNMPAAEQHELEEILDADPFLNDAVEGLAEIKDKQQLKEIANQINVHLRRQIKNRRKNRRSRTKLTDHWGWIFALVVLLLIVICWIVMKAVTKAG
jgi:anti-sigma factor RsiW